MSDPAAPNPELMHLYGTDSYYLEKTGAVPPLLQAAAPLAFLGAAAADSGHVDRLLAEAEAMNQAFRFVEHHRMSQTIAGFKGASALSPELQKIAEDLGHQLAREAAELEKEALVGSLIGKGITALGKGLGKAGKKVGWGSTGAIGRGGAAQSAGTGLRQAGVGLQRAGKKMAPATAAPAAAGAAITKAAPAAAPAAASAAPAAAAVAKKKPLIGWGTKAKVVGAGAMLGTGYAGYKGLQTARDYMMQPTGSTRHGRYGPSPRHNVSQMGY